MPRSWSSVSAFIAAFAIGAAWIPAAAADYGPARDVHDVRSTMQRESSAHDHYSVHDVTAVGDYAIVSRGEPPASFRPCWFAGRAPGGTTRAAAATGSSPRSS